MKRNIFIAVMAILLVAILSACGSVKDPAAQAVEQYLAAMVAGNSDQIVSYACKTYEEQARQDVDSFAGVKASLDKASCQKSGTSVDATLVTCQGKIQATYGNENQSFDLSGQTYQVIQEGGEWRVCGRQ